MSVISRTGDIFTTEASVIAHGVNCRGFMGAGIALSIARKFPAVLSPYKNACDSGTLRPGVTQFVRTNPEQNLAEPVPQMWVANVGSQLDPGADARLDWLVEAMLRAYTFMTYSVNAPTIAIPQIGCGIGGLTWDVVGPVLAGIAKAHHNIDTELWTYAP